MVTEYYPKDLEAGDMLISEYSPESSDVVIILAIDMNTQEFTYKFKHIESTRKTPYFRGWRKLTPLERLL